MSPSGLLAWLPEVTLPLATQAHTHISLASHPGLPNRTARSQPTLSTDRQTDRQRHGSLQPPHVSQGGDSHHLHFSQGVFIERSPKLTTSARVGREGTTWAARRVLRRAGNAEEEPMMSLLREVNYLLRLPLNKDFGIWLNDFFQSKAA